ncbi:hypothetical protein DL770_007033 [Monosporascus sp. CRB-9-2]|nr:hypothetical protein DL770_007033 [Monosporascus sp. CRB-9-2]
MRYDSLFSSSATTVKMGGGAYFRYAANVNLGAGGGGGGAATAAGAAPAATAAAAAAALSAFRGDGYLRVSENTRLPHKTGFSGKNSDNSSS